jgi:hypothetical protein
MIGCRGSAPVPTPPAPVPTPCAPVPTPRAPVPTPRAPVPTPRAYGATTGGLPLRKFYQSNRIAIQKGKCHQAMTKVVTTN